MASSGGWLRWLPFLRYIRLAWTVVQHLPKPLRDKVVKVALALCLVCGSNAMGDDVGVTHYTPIGARERISLWEGSILDINANTVALVKESSRHRQVFLENGEIRATVRHDASNPMEVIIDHVVLSDEGTQFNVAVNEGTINIAVTEGRLRVFETDRNGARLDPIAYPSRNGRREPLILRPGDVVRLEQHGGSTIVVDKATELNEAAGRSSWLQDFYCDSQRLDEVVWEFNRYNKTPVVIVDPDVARIEVGGCKQLTDLRGFLSTLHKMAGLQAMPIKGPHGTVETLILTHAGQSGPDAPAAPRSSKAF
jgi:transmembrane sensor